VAATRQDRCGYRRNISADLTAAGLASMQTRDRVRARHMALAFMASTGIWAYPPCNTSERAVAITCTRASQQNSQAEHACYSCVARTSLLWTTKHPDERTIFPDGRTSCHTCTWPSKWQTSRNCTITRSKTSNRSIEATRRPSASRTSPFLKEIEPGMLWMNHRQGSLEPAATLLA
jgi:hypothetical protein